MVSGLLDAVVVVLPCCSVVEVSNRRPTGWVPGGKPRKLFLKKSRDGPGAELLAVIRDLPGESADNIATYLGRHLELSERDRFAVSVDDWWICWPAVKLRTWKCHSVSSLQAVPNLFWMLPVSPWIMKGSDRPDVLLIFNPLGICSVNR